MNGADLSTPHGLTEEQLRGVSTIDGVRSCLPASLTSLLQPHDWRVRAGQHRPSGERRAYCRMRSVAPENLPWPAMRIAPDLEAPGDFRP